MTDSAKKTVGLSLKYRAFDPEQADIADDLPEAFQVTVTRSDGFGMTELDVMTALDLALASLRRKRKAARDAAGSS